METRQAMATEAREPASPMATSAPSERSATGPAVLRRIPSRVRVAAVVWLLMVVGFVLFLVTGSVTLEAGSRRGRTMRVTEIWWRFGDAVPEVGSAALLRIAVYGAVVAVLGLAALGLWLALTARDQPTADQTGEQRDPA